MTGLGRVGRPGRAACAAIGVVDRVEEPVVALEAERREPPQVRRALRRHEHGRERGGVRRDDQLVAQAALQTQSGNAERLVLIGAVPIDGAVGRLGDAPRHAERRRRSRSGAGRPSGRTRRAACRDTCASAAAASGTRTASRSTTAAPARRARRSTARPRWNQCDSGTSPLAIARKLASRASEASRS